MREGIYLLCVLAVTVYLAVTAWEDHKTCEVTRWKHLIGGIPAILMYFVNLSRHSLEENVIILAFSAIYVTVGFVGVYGLADGLVLAALSLFFGSIGGIAGSGAVLLIIVIAAFSFLAVHVFKCLRLGQKLTLGFRGALIPHVLFGYAVIVGIIMTNL